MTITMKTFLGLLCIAIVGITLADSSPLDELQIYGLDHLSDKKLLQLIDYLGFDDLMILAMSNMQMQRYIEKRYILGKYQLQSHPLKISVIRGAELIAHGDHKISTFNVILAFLRMYGAHIPAIHIQSIDASNQYFEEIGRYIERYCRATVTELRLQNEATVLLNRWNQSFDNVFHVNIDYNRPIERFNELFPSLSLLTIERTNEELSQSEHLEMPQLSVFYYHEKVLDASPTFLVNVLRSNPQLRRLHLHSFFNSGVFELLPTNSLNQLETLELRTSMLTAETIKFIGVNKQLQQLSLPRASVTYTQLKQIIGDLNELKELHIRWTSKLASNELINVLSGNNHLEFVKIDLDFGVDSNDQFEENVTFDKQWTIVDKSTNAIRLLRN